jgi:hypothetical protein
MSFSPETQRGVYVMAGSDNLAQMWAMVVETLAYDIMADREDADRETQMLAMFERAAAEYRQERTANRLAALALVEHSAWSPTRAELARYAATYRNAALGDLCVSLSSAGLRYSAGAYSAQLLPVAPGVFIAMDEGVDVERISIEEGVFVWGDDRFERVETGQCPVGASH